MINTYSAIDFVLNHGSPVERARLRYLISGDLPSPEVVNSLTAGQRADGGWPPFWAPEYSSLDATCFRIAQGEQLGILNTEEAFRRAAAFLTHRQRPDGTWEEDESVSGLTPPWAAPGDAAARLYLTANCGFWLSILGGASSLLESAADVLENHLSDNGQMPSYLHTHWLAAGLWASLGRQTTSEAVLDYLHTRLDDLPASNLAWLLITVRIGGISSSNRAVQAMASRLETSQGPGGFWVNDEDPGQDVHTTLEALRALYLCGRVRFAPE